MAKSTRGWWKFLIYLSFLTLITDMMTRRLPKIAAVMIKIIIKAVKTVIKTLIHSWSIISSVLVLLKLLIVALEFEKVTAVTNSFIVRICSLLNDEEDDNFGDNVWDDMVGGSAFISFPDFLSSLVSTSLSFYVTFESTRDDEKQIKSQQFFLSLRCKNKAFMFLRFTMVCYKLKLVGKYYCLIWLNCACELITWFPPEMEERT